MEYTTDKLLGEILKFVELCQTHTMKGKIGIDCYCSLTGSKLRFIKDLLREENTSFFDREIRKKLKNIRANDIMIHAGEMQAVGK